MTNLEKYKQAFTEALGISDDETQSAKYQEQKSWDSVGHMALVAILEETFEIMMDTEDIIDFSSFEKGKVILRKYDVEL